jgi:hypothetical protein
LQIVPPALRARFYTSGKAAPDSEPFLKASEVLRKALSLIKTPSESNINEALSALRLLNGLLAKAGIDEVTLCRCTPRSAAEQPPTSAVVPPESFGHPSESPRGAEPGREWGATGCFTTRCR